MPVVWTAPMTRPSQLRSRRMNAAQAVSGSRRVTVAMASDLGASSRRASIAMLGPFDLGREASAHRIVGVDRLDCGIGEQFADVRIRFAWLREERVGHHPVL